MRRGYTLIEIIITVAITGILSIGMFKAFEAITVRSEKAKILTTLSIDSQSALDQISLLLYNRAPIKLMGCDNTGNCEPLDSDTIANKVILTWYGTANESYQSGDYSGFVDMNASINAKPILKSPHTNLSNVLSTQQTKWGSSFVISNLGLVFAGAFEDSVQDEAYPFQSNSGEIEFTNPSNISKIYEKYYLVDSAYAITRKENNPCGAAYTNKDKDDLLLYYDFRPWNGGQTMCNGKVSLLSKNVNGFSAHVVNGTIRLGIDMNRSVGNDQTRTVRLSKQKVVF